MVDVGGTLTRKIGPLPAWGWGVAIGGGLLAVRMMGGRGGGTERTVIEVPTGAPYPADELTSEIGEALLLLRNRVDDLADRVNDNTDDKKPQPSPSVPPPSNNQPGSAKPVALPSGADIGTFLIGLRSRFSRAPSVAPAGETRAQRESRLRAELAAFGTQGKFDLGTYVIGLRKQFPKIASLWKEAQKPNESVAERTARLRREIAFFASRGAAPASSIAMTPTSAA